MEKKEYLLPVKEAAELLGISDRAVQKNAMNGKYGSIRYSTERTRCRGGKMILLSLENLPDKAQSEYMRRHQLVDEPLREESSAYDRAGKAARLVANERLHIIKEYESSVAVPGKKTELTMRFIAEWNESHPENTISKSTLYSWQRSYNTGGMEKLLPEYGKKSGKRLIDEDAWAFFQQQYLQLSRPSIAMCYQILELESRSNDWTIPSEKTIARMVKQDIPEAVRVLRRYGDKKYYDNVQTYTQRNMDLLPAGDTFVGDHHVFDLFVNTGTVEKPKWSRPWLTAWMDMRSRKLVGWTVNLSPCTDEIIAAFANAALDPSIGLPRNIYIDNGRDYCSAKFAGRGARGKKLTPEDQERLMEEGKATQTLMNRLGIKTHFAIVENARAKVIEREFKNLVERFSKMMPLYCGRNQNERPDSLAAKLKNAKKYSITLDEFRKIFNEWAIHVMNKIKSKGQARTGECPDETYMRTRKPVRVADPEVLRLFFMKSTHPFRIGRNGITFKGAQYWNDELILLKGRHAFIRYRDEDPDRIWLYDTHDAYLGELKRLEALCPVNEDGEAIAAEQQRKARERKQVVQHPSYLAAKADKPLDAATITELFKLYGDTAEDVKPSKVVEMVSLPKEGKEAVRSMKATGTDDINPFEAMCATKIEKRRGF